MRAWSISEAETPVRPFVKTTGSCQVVTATLTEVGICGVTSEEMELEGEAEVEKEEVTKGAVNVSGETADKVSKDDGVREVRRLVDPLKPIQKEVDERAQPFPYASSALVPDMCSGERESLGSPEEE